MASSTGKKGGRKFGRTNRGFSHGRYNTEKRWVVNKAKRVAKQVRKFPKYIPFNLGGDVKYHLDKMGFET